MSVSVLVADDHPMFRAGMVTVLQDLDDIEVVGQATNGREAVELVGQLDPDVVLMDLRMPEVGGLEATARIKVEHPDTAVIVLTMDSDDDSIFAALRAGARGYLLKESDGLDIERVLTLFSQGRSTAVSPFPELTPRELEMLELIAGGLDNPTIARRLFLSEKTVRNRVSAILTKLHARSRAEMVALARDAGLGGPAEPGR
jgi:DNA-binding NarL/FixJ family response regulator